MNEAFQFPSLVLVVRGPFAPAMFHPLWFQQYDLIGKSEALAAIESENIVISPDVTLFKVAGFDINARQDRLQIGTTLQNLFEPLRDLMCSVLGVLEAQPVSGIGINWAIHYSTASQKAWHQAGDRMVPKQFWNSVWEKHVGMQGLLLQLEREDTLEGVVNLKIEPSKNVQNGVYLEINDHYEHKKNEKDGTASDAASLIENKFLQSKKMADKLFDDIYKETTRV